MRFYKTTGIVIKRRNIGEADRILTIFTNDKGKIQVKAPNVRKIPSRRSGHTELLNLGTFFLHRGHVLPILTEAQTIQDFEILKKDLSKIGFAYHVCELVDGLCAENQENIKIYHLLEHALHQISEEENPSLIVNEFELELLSLLGFYTVSRFQNIQNVHAFIENLLERSLKSKKIIPLFRA